MAITNNRSWALKLCIVAALYRQFVLKFGMKWSRWVESFLMFASFVLLQTTKKPSDIVFFVDEDTEETIYNTDLSVEERLVLIPMHLSKTLNNAVGFVTTNSELFTRVFIEDDATSLRNLGTLSNVYTHGIMCKEHFWEMVYCVIGHPTEE